MVLTPTLRARPIKEQLLILDGLNGRPHPSSGHTRSACLWLSSAPPGRHRHLGRRIRRHARSSAGAARSPRRPATFAGVRAAPVSEPDARDVSLLAIPGVPMGSETDPAKSMAECSATSAPRLLPAEHSRCRRRGRPHVAFESRPARSAPARRISRIGPDAGARHRRLRARRRQRTAGQMPRPEGPPATLRDHVRLMADLLVVALQIDFTRRSSPSPRATRANQAAAHVSPHARRLRHRPGPVRWPGQSADLDFGHHKCSDHPRPTLPMIQAIDRWYVRSLPPLSCQDSNRSAKGWHAPGQQHRRYGSTNSSGTGNGNNWRGHSLRDVL